MFTTLVVQPVFNALVTIYSLLPGHDFGLAIILFTILVRLLLWPLVRKQLRNAKLMRELQPELKRIKKQSKGDRQAESQLIMSLYKERGVSPFGSIIVLLLQMPILFGLFIGLKKLVDDPNAIIDFSYPFVRDLSWMQVIANDVHNFSASLFDLINLKKAALADGGIYWPAMVIVVASAVTQFYQSKQLMPDDGSRKKLRQIMKDASNGVETDQAEVTAAVGQMTKYFIPVMIFFVTVNIASAISLYWFVSGLVAVIQQTKIFKEDEETMEESAKAKPGKKTSAKSRATSAVEAEIVTKSNSSKKRKKAKSTARVVSISSELKPQKINTVSGSKNKTKSKRKSKKRRK